MVYVGLVLGCFRLGSGLVLGIYVGAVIFSFRL